MSPMEQALRDEIAWHEDRIAALENWREVKPALVNSIINHHRARLAALTAALPAPGEIRQAQAMREALAEIGRSGDRYTSGDGHAQCVAIALAALTPEPPR